MSSFTDIAGDTSSFTDSAGNTASFNDSEGMAGSFTKNAATRIYRAHILYRDNILYRGGRITAFTDQVNLTNSFTDNES